MKNADYRRLSAIVMLPIICMIVIISRDMITIEKQTEDNEELVMLEKCLERNHLEYGYASFWQANIVTLLSDSKVKSRVINIDEFGFEKRLYQTNRRWYEEVTSYEQYFVVLDEEEYEIFQKYDSNFNKPVDFIKCGRFKILVYEKNIFK